MAMKKRSIWLFGALLAAGVIQFALQQQAQARLRDEIAVLGRQKPAWARLRRENQRLTASLVPREELERLRREQSELEHLRAALATTRTRIKVQAEAHAANDPPKPLAPGMTPVASLTIAGLDTPTAAVLSFFWAVAQIDADALAKQLVFSPDARIKAEALFASLDEASRQRLGTPEKMMGVFFVEMFARTSGLQIVGYDPTPPPDFSAWRAKVQTAGGRLRDVDFPIQRTADGWREVIEAFWIDNWSQYLR